MRRYFYLVILILVTLPANLLPQEKPLLSEAIRQAIDTKGIDYAKKQFLESYESQKNKYEIDVGSVSKLSSEYIKEGKMDEAGAVMEIATPWLQQYTASKMGGDYTEMMKKEKSRTGQDKKAETSTVKKEDKNDNSLGKPRNDLERFTGIYGDPSEKNETRRLWVQVSCDGYLVSGALWGDASPWWMKSESDKVFTYKDSFNELKMEFVTGSNGKAVNMVHDLSFMKTPLERLGPIPDDWEPCIKRERR
jgi:hypothetical protein